MHLRFIESSDATTSRPQQEQAPAPQTCVSRETAAPHFIAPPLAPQATEAAPRTARTTAQVQVRTRYHPRIVSRETFGTCAYRRAHPQTRSHASTTHSTTDTNKRGATPRQHPAQSLTHTYTARIPADPHTRIPTEPYTRSAPRPHAQRPQRPTAAKPSGTPRRPASPPPLAQLRARTPVPRREDPGEHEARGEHQDDRGARGHVQRPGEVQARRGPRRRRARATGSSWSPGGHTGAARWPRG